MTCMAPRTQHRKNNKIELSPTRELDFQASEDIKNLIKCGRVACFCTLKNAKVPNLEAQSAPRTQRGGPRRSETPIFRPKAVQDPKLGGSKPSQESNFETQSTRRSPIGGPKPLKDVDLETHSVSKRSTWRTKASPSRDCGGAKAFKDTNLEAQSFSKALTYRKTMLRGTYL